MRRLIILFACVASVSVQAQQILEHPKVVVSEKNGYLMVSGEYRIVTGNLKAFSGYFFFPCPTGTCDSISIKGGKKVKVNRLIETDEKGALVKLIIPANDTALYAISYKQRITSAETEVYWPKQINGFLNRNHIEIDLTTNNQTSRQIGEVTQPINHNASTTTNNYHLLPESSFPKVGRL